MTLRFGPLRHATLFQLLAVYFLSQNKGAQPAYVLDVKHYITAHDNPYNQLSSDYLFDAAVARDSRRVCKVGPVDAAAVGAVAYPDDHPQDEAHHMHTGHGHGAATAAVAQPIANASAVLHHCRRRPCVLTRGSWCQGFEAQQPVAWLAPPLGAKDCPSTQWGMCNNVGNCNHATGLCECPAGWRGPDCATRDKRPCTHRLREEHDPPNEPVSHVGPDGRDKDPNKDGWTASRCGGWCDEDIAMCFCPPGTKHGRKPPPEGSPPGTPPLQRGRPMPEHCQPNTDAAGVKLTWGARSWDSLFGPQGYCNADRDASSPAPTCGCPFHGSSGHWCDAITETACPNQCSGRGRCVDGFCKCDLGWYGTECGAPREGTQLDEDALQGRMGTQAVKERPWLKPVVGPVPAAAQRPPAATRLRPLIYVYDLPPKYNTRMLQYGFGLPSCTYRSFKEENMTIFKGGVYSLEQYLHEVLLQSEHRTLNPEEADFFYVPVYQGCFMWPVLGWADGPYWHAPHTGLRPIHAAYMWLEVMEWIKANFPYWDRHGGRDHVWLAPHDEGACYMPSAVYNTSIILTHWGRLDMNHISGTSYYQDIYTNEFPKEDDPRLRWMGARNPGPADWRDLWRGHPCYDPAKDLVVPAFKAPRHYADSPLMGTPPMVRDILLFFRGDCGTHRGRQAGYSRGLRQKLYSLSKEKDWPKQYKAYIGEQEDFHGSYSEELARSLFCLVLPGDGWSARAEDAVLHGCIPVIIMDGVHVVYESILDWDAFSVRLPEAAVNEHLPKLLQAVTPERLARMQHNLASIMHRFAYAHGPMVEQDMERALQERAHFPPVKGASAAVPPHYPFQPLRHFPKRHDALNTILQWLHGRMLRPTGGAAAGGHQLRQDVGELHA